MAPAPVFALLTDFGLDFAVASMKALLINAHPQAQVIDIDHNVSKFSLVSGSFIIEKVFQYFPKGSIFICIIDPGVGSQREALCIETQSYTFFGPNNGLFHHILQHKRSTSIYQINEKILKPATYTFHGRDLFVPAAIHYAHGSRDFLIPLSIDKIIYLDKHDIENVIAYIDSFGNIKTTILVDDTFNEASTLLLSLNQQIHELRFVKTFSDTPAGTLLCYKGSNETLEIAVNLGSAQRYLQASVGDKICMHHVN